jgi:hypothetical protein
MRFKHVASKKLPKPNAPLPSFSFYAKTLLEKLMRKKEKNLKSALPKSITFQGMRKTAVWPKSSEK